MNATENKSFHLSEQVHFTIYPSLPAPDFVPEKETCEFQF